ncbi:MAG: site-specific tyrosine recombinase/integron integrase [Candidatus Neomarinimicrobiota bacterium]
MNNPPSDIINDFLSYIGKERNYSQNTLKSYGRDLQRFQAFIQTYSGEPDTTFGNVDKLAIRHFLGAEFEQGYSSRTVARRLASLKSFFKYLLRAEEISANPTIGIKTPRTPKTLPNYIPEKLIDELMAAPRIDTLNGLCDRAVLELFYSTGMRLSELTGLNIGHVDFNNQVVKVRGKGNKERIIPFGPQARKSLEQFLRERGITKYRTEAGQPLFTTKGNRRISIRTIQRRVKKYLQNLTAGTALGPHTLRHTFATHMLDHGADIRSVKDLLGHSSLSSTQVYTHLQPDRMKKIYRQAHPHGGSSR